MFRQIREIGSKAYIGSKEVVKIGKSYAKKYVLFEEEPGLSPSSEELARVIVARLGLMSRKKGSSEKMHKVLIELYERAKEAAKKKEFDKAIMTVEEMALFAGITRQTMYDYLKRWLDLELIQKTSYVGDDRKVVIGYKLNGNTLEQAFEKAKAKIITNLEFTLNYIRELQRIVKNEKISKTFKQENIKSES